MKLEVLGEEVLFRGWLTVRGITLGVGDARQHREVVDRADAACALPYDPERRVAILARAPRATTVVRGEAWPLLEAPAGLIDAGEDAAACIRREGLEEVGYRLGELERVGGFWSSAGVLTQKIWLYLAAVRASDRVGAGGGAEGEGEHIAVVETPLRELAALADRGELPDIKTALLTAELRRRRPELFA